MIDFIYIILSWVLALGLFYFLLNFWTKGFFAEFIKVKISRGRKILLRIHTMTEITFKAGKINENSVEYKRNKKEYTLTIPSKSTYTYLSVPTIDFDEVSQNFIIDKTHRVAGSDHNVVNMLLKRAYLAGKLAGNQDKIIKLLLILSLVTTAGVAIALFMIWGMSGEIAAITTNAVGRV